MQRKNSIVIYHRVDFDGLFSSAIVEKFINECSDYVGYDLFGYTYGDEIPDPLMWLERGYNSIIMVDISFPTEVMLKYRDLCLSDQAEVIWIDHHVTAIDDSFKNGYSDLPGLRGLDVAACEYSWMFFYPKTQIPSIIQYLSAYDTWNKMRFDWSGAVFPIQLALKAKYGLNQESISKDFSNNLVYMNSDQFYNIVESGKLICKYLERTWKAAVKTYSFEIQVAGKFRGIAIMSTEFSSNTFNSVIEDYDVCCVVNRRGPNQYSCSLYVEPGKDIPFNAGEYLKEMYGGGGHKGAAGCVLTKEQFDRLTIDCMI